METGRLHLMAIHFPIALVFSGLLAELLYLVLRKDFFKHAGRYCVVVGGLSSVCAVLTGIAAAPPQYSPGGMLATHKWVSIGAMAFGLLAVAGAILDGVRGGKIWGIIYWVLLVLFAILTGFSGYIGGMLGPGR